MADRKISELPPFPHHEVIQNSDVNYIVASGLASETIDATNYRVPFTGLSYDILRDFGAGSAIIDADSTKIRIGSIEPGDDRPVELQDDVYILGDLYTESDLHVDGDAFFDQNVSITGNINASGDVDFQDLYVHGNAFVKHDTTISGDLTVLGNSTTIETEKLVAEDSNIEIGDHKEFTTEDTANFGGITLKTHNNNSFASVVINGVTITSRIAGVFGNNIKVAMLSMPGLSLEDGVILTDPNDLHGNSVWGRTNITVIFSVFDISERTQGDLADLLNCYAGHLVHANASNRNAALSNFPDTFLQGGLGQDGFNKNIEWIKPCDAWTMNANLNVYGSGNFSQGIHLATDQIIGGIKVALHNDDVNYGGLGIINGYLKIDGWETATSTAGEASFFLSDVNLKDDRKNIESSTEILNQINGIYFTWNESADSSLTGKKDIGVIAQEVQSVLPEIVTENKDGHLAVYYHKIIPVLIESIKELSQENKSLKSRIDRLESKQ